MNKIEKNKNKIQNYANRSISKVLSKNDSLNEELNIKVNINRKSIYKSSIKNSYSQQIGEIIVKILLDKIISLSVRQSKNKDRNHKIQNYYYNFIINQINTLFSLNYIFYTEEPENDSFNDYSKYWKNNQKKINTWIEIMEPKPSKCDRHESVCVQNICLEKNNKAKKFENLKRNGDSKYSINENNDKNQIKDIKTKNKKNFRFLMNELESLEEVGSDSDEEERIRRKEKKYSTINSTRNKSIKEIKNIINNNNLSSNLSDEKKLTKRKKNVSFFTSEDIPGINNELNFEKYDPPNIELLRKEKEKEIKEKIELSRILKLKKNSLFNKGIVGNYKLFDSDKLTFDSDGKIIKFKPLNLNTLAKDFKLLNHKPTNLNPLQKLSEKNTFKNNKKIKNKNIISISSLNIIKNPKDNPDLNKEDFVSINPKNKNKIIQSGNNFSLFLPNVGVILRDENKVKKGERDFKKYFNKYSFEDFDKIQNEDIPKENQALIIKKSTSNHKLMSSSMNNNGNFNVNSLDFSNPLINKNNQENNTTNINNLNATMNKKISLNTIKNKIFSKSKDININISSILIDKSNNYFSKKVNNRHTFFSKLSNYIKLKKVNSSSLKLELDSLNDLELKNRFLSPEHSKRKFENLFSVKYKYLFKKEKQNNISENLDELNRNIISDVEWGAKTMRKNASTKNILFPKYQNKFKLFNEFGSNFNNNFKIKFPRERRVKLID